MSSNAAVANPGPGAGGQPPTGQLTTQQTGVKYVCGECGVENLLRAREPVQCRSCGYRILYKMRTQRMVQFLAR